MRLLDLSLRLLTAWLVAMLISGMGTHTLLAATYYVDANAGDDSGDADAAQNPDTPWKSLSRAINASALTSGDIVYVGPGDYGAGDVPNGTAEMFPLVVPDGVSIIGTGLKTNVVSNGDDQTAFDFRGEIGPETYLADLALSGNADSAIRMAMFGGATQSPTLDGLAFLGNYNQAIDLNVSKGGGGTFGSLIQNNTFGGSGNAIELSATSSSALSAAVTIQPVLTGNTFSNGRDVLHVYLSSASAELNVAVDFAGNQVLEGDDIVDVNVYYNYEPVNVSATLTANSISFDDNDYSAVDVYVSSASSADISVDSNISDNTFSEGNAAVDLYLYDINDANVSVDVTLTGNTYSDMESGVEMSFSSMNSINLAATITASDEAGQLNWDYAGYYEYYNDGVDSAVDLSLSASTLTMGGDVVSIDVSSVDGGGMVANVSITDNEIDTDTDSDNDVLDFVYYDADEQDLELTAVITGNTQTNGDDLVEISISSNSSASVDVLLDVQDNVTNNATGELTEFYVYYMYPNLGTDLDMTLAGNTVAAGRSGLEFNLSSLSEGEANVSIDMHDNDLDVEDYGAYAEFYYLYGDLQLNADVSITNNSISSDDDGIYFSLTSITSISADLTLDILDNEISQAGDSAIEYYLSNISGSSNIDAETLIAGNTLSNADTGIYGSAYSNTNGTIHHDLSIVSNDISGTTNDGIYWASPYYFTGSVDWAENVTVHGNTISPASGDGIYIEISEASSFSSAVFDWTITNNTVTGGNTGIEIDADTIASVNFDFTALIEGNTVTGTVDEGISIQFSDWSSSVTADVAIIGNTVTNAGGDGLYIDLSSIFSADSVQVSIKDNVLSGNGGYGLYLYEYYSLDDQTYVTIEGNTVTGNLGAGVVIETSRSSSSAPLADLGGGSLSSPGLNTFAGNFGFDVTIGDPFNEPDRKKSAEGIEGIDIPTNLLIYSALNNFWGTQDNIEIEQNIRDVEDNIAEMIFPVRADVDPGSPLAAQPSVAVAATLEAAVTDNGGLSGASPGDFIDFTATVSSTGDIGCASASFTAPMPDGYQLIGGNIVGNAQPFYADEVGVGLGNLEAGSTVILQWTMLVEDEAACEDLVVQGIVSCAQMGTVLTEDTTTGGATVVSTGMATYYADADGDSYGDAENSWMTCDEAAPEGYASNSDDCDDTDEATYLGADEICDESDNDCDGTVDEGATNTYYTDADGDGYGDGDATTAACDTPDGTVDNSDDCDDDDDTSFPGAKELCDEVDNDCDGTTDEGAGDTIFFTDDDGDGYGDPDTGAIACEATGDQVTNANDCDDGDDDSYPGATETCDGNDNDCDGDTDEDLGDEISYVDSDGDGFGDPETGDYGCDLTGDRVDNANDCNDDDADSYPGATETCDGEDNNCDGDTDEGVEVEWYVDADSDGYGDPLTYASGCSVADASVNNGDDCDDAEAANYPGADEICDDIDNDCDGMADESADCIPDSTPTEGGVDAGGGGGCDTSGNAAGKGLIGFLLLGLAIRPRRLTD